MIQASEGAEGFVQIDLDGNMYEVRLKVMTLSGYSGHADQSALVSFVQAMTHVPGRVVLVHGERHAKVVLQRALRACLEARYPGFEVLIPE